MKITVRLDDALLERAKIRPALVTMLVAVALLPGLVYSYGTMLQPWPPWRAVPYGWGLLSKQGIEQEDKK